MINNTRTFYLLLLCSIPYLLCSQQIGTVRFENITNNSIISNSNIRAITEDKRGFLWIATNNGLCRYDPNGKVTPVLKDKSNTLQSNTIRSLMSDRSGNLWIGTFSGGLTRFNPEQNSWKTFFPDPKDTNSISNEDILSILEDRQGRIWIGTEYGLNVFNPATETFTRFLPNQNDEQAIQAKAIVSILEDKIGRIWLSTWHGGLYLVLPHESGDLDKTTFRRFNPGSKKRSHNVWQMYQDKQERYWVATYGEGMFLMQLPIDATNDPKYQTWFPKFHNYTQEENNPTGLQSNRIFEFNQDQQNRLWITTNDGITHIDADDLPNPSIYKLKTKDRPVLKFKTHLNHIEKSHSIRNNCVNTVYTDKNNIIWFGTLEGLSKFNPNPIMFDYFSFTERMTNSSNNQNIYVDQHKKAWIANNEKGLLWYDLVAEEYIELPIQLKEKLTTVNGLYAKNQSLFLGTKNGFKKINLKNFQIETYTLPDDLKQKLSGFTVRCIWVDDSDQVWIGTENGLIRYNNTQQKFAVYRFDIHDPSSISDNAINAIYQDTKGTIWIATYNGLNKIQHHTKEKIIFHRYKSSPDKGSNSIISNQVLGIEEANDHLYLYTTVGLCKYSFANKSFSPVFSTGEKFHLYSLKHLEENYLWGSSTRGIVRYDLTKQTYTIFGREYGVWDMNFNEQSVYQAADGDIYFGTEDGLTKFHPQHINTDTTTPEIFITEVNLANDHQDTAINTISLKTLFVPKNYKKISLTFTTLNFDRSQKSQFSFRLKGFEETWRTPQNATSVHYTNLSHGNYTFQVKGSNCDGLWNDVSTDLPIAVEAQFYETTSFHIILICLVAGIIFLGFKIYGRALNYRNRQMERLVNIRTKELAEKNSEVGLLLEKLKNHNELLEATVTQRTQRLMEANEELLRSNQDLEQFAYIASHDLQEPLRTVGSFVNLLGRRYKDQLDDNANQYIDFAVDGVTRMSKLITNILIYSKVGKKELKFSPANISHIIELKLRDLQTKIVEKNVDISIQLGELPSVICEKNQIGMVFYNLINNAIKFNKAAYPKITIKYHPEGPSDFWMFSVTDNGIGIKAEYQRKVFEIFRRLHIKTEYEGSGIGLALCKKIVFRHKGDIWIDSKFGQGSTFYFRIAKNLKEADSPIERTATAEKVIVDI